MGIENLRFGRGLADLREANALSSRLSALRRSTSRRRIDLTARVEELELDLMRVAFADGVGDGGLDPKLVEPGVHRFANLEPIAPENAPFDPEEAERTDEEDTLDSP